RKPNMCDDCEKAFSTSGHLLRHQRMLAREMVHACPFPGCTTRSVRKNNLGQQCHHSNPPPGPLRSC
ncbi:hypothetical protein DFH09DRAFT_920599, partial [Mycena vulgaris]